MIVLAFHAPERPLTLELWPNVLLPVGGRRFE